LEKIYRYASQGLYLVAPRDNGVAVNLAVAIGCAEGIVKSGDSNLLSSNGGHITLTKHWATGSR
jgi:hypothetical protein